MLVVNLGCPPHFEQGGEVSFCRSCLSMRHRMPRRPCWQVKRKDVSVIGGLSKIDHAPLRKGPCSDDDPLTLSVEFCVANSAYSFRQFHSRSTSGAAD